MNNYDDYCTKLFGEHSCTEEDCPTCPTAKIISEYNSELLDKVGEEYNKGYEKGKADAMNESVSIIKELMPLIVLETYKQGKADQKKDDNEFFNFEAAWELEKRKIRADAIEEFYNRLLENKVDINLANTPWNYIELVAREMIKQLKGEKE